MEAKYDITALLRKLVAREDLRLDEAYQVAQSLSRGEFSPALAGGVLTALVMKGECSSEIGGFVKAMRECMVEVNLPITAGGEARDVIVDTCGTGGDHGGTFNISTLTGIVLAACGVRVAKHGNRAITSACGSADLLRGLGVNIELTAQAAGQVLAEVGQVFLFAPLYHPAMQHIVPIRQALKLRTIFNLLGPLLNPLTLDYQLLGVATEELLEKLAQALVHTPLKGALVVHGTDGLDEITLTGKTNVIEYRSAAMMGGQPTWERYQLDPSTYGFAYAHATELKGGSLAENCQSTHAILAAAEQRRSILVKRDVVLLNVAVVLKLIGQVNTVTTGVAQAREAILSGAAAAGLRQLIEKTNSFA